MICDVVTAGSCLVLIDLQNEFLSSDGNFPISDLCKSDLISNLKAFLPRFRQSGGHVIWVKAIYEERIEETTAMKEQQRGDGTVGNNKWLTVATHVHPTPCCAAGSFGAEIYPEVQVLSRLEDTVVTKHAYSAFNRDKGLLCALRKRNAAKVHFCGVASGTCVLASVIDAVKLGEFEVHVVPECMGWRRYNTHEEAIRRFKELKVNLVDINDFEVTEPGL